MENKIVNGRSRKIKAGNAPARPFGAEWSRQRSGRWWRCRWPWWRWFRLGNGQLGELTADLCIASLACSKIGGQLGAIARYRYYPLPDIKGIAHVLPRRVVRNNSGGWAAPVWSRTASRDCRLVHAINSQGIESNAI